MDEGKGAATGAAGKTSTSNAAATTATPATPATSATSAASATSNAAATTVTPATSAASGAPHVEPVRTMRGAGIARASLGRRLAALACCLGMLAGSALLTWVWASPLFNAWVAGNQFSSGTSQDVDLNSPARLATLEQAQAYNQQMAGNLTLPVTGVKTYEYQLASNDDGVMSWVDIPKIDVKLPVYHGDSDETLMRGLGHLDYTSLPVGGVPSHCVITGHSGMPGNYMFDDLELLRVGDLFVLWTLNEPYAYRVYDIDVVDPTDSSSLEIVQGRDLATLVTCTPYRINTHRLLVHAERTDYDPDEIAAARAHRPLHLDRLLALAAAVAAMLALPLVWTLINYGILAWGKRGTAMLIFGLLKRVRLKVRDTQTGTWHRASGRRRANASGRILVRFTKGDLEGCMQLLGRGEMAQGHAFEAFGDHDAITLHNLSNGEEMTFWNKTAASTEQA